MSTSSRQKMTHSLQRQIESILEARTGRACCFMPSGRFGMYAAFRLLLRPGQRILMSPLEDDTVFFGALAAGLRPVMAPISADDGNIVVGAIPESVWPTLGAVLTGNTYGLPDQVVELKRRCERSGIVLIEDAAHALQTDIDGRAIGSFGSASVFSLSKHLPGRGGILSVDDRIDRADVAELRNELVAARPLDSRARFAARSALRTALETAHLRPAAQRVKAMLHPVKAAPWRVPLRSEALNQAVYEGGLAAFDPWMETAYPDYRMTQDSGALERTLEALRTMALDRERRLAGVGRLQALECVAPAARSDPAPLLRVPLLIEDRDAVALELRRRRVSVHFVYDPPLDAYAGTDYLEAPHVSSAATWWGAHVLPVNPHEAGRVLGLIDAKQIQLAPANPPSLAGNAAAQLPA
jgi:hypothetical protein